MRKPSVLIVAALAVVSLYVFDMGATDANSQNPKVRLVGDVPVLELPDTLQAFIRKEFPDFRVPDAGDISGGWAETVTKGVLPYVCMGDFNKDGNEDVALLLIGEHRWRTFAFHQMKDGTWRKLRLERLPGTNAYSMKLNPPQQFHLYTLKAGDKVKVGELDWDRSVYKFDTILFSRLKNPTRVMQYRWVHDAYVARMWHGEQ